MTIEPEPERRASLDDPTHNPLLEGHRVPLTIAIVLWLLAGSLFIALAVPGLDDVVQSVDDGVHSIAVDLESELAADLATGLDFAGSVWITWPIILLIAAFLGWRRRWEALIYWVLAMSLSQLAIGPVKALYGRARPPMPLVVTSGDSFPSGHAVAVAAIAVGLVIVLLPAGARRRMWELGAAAVATTMALSRVYLRAHWLSDVVAGAALGAALAIGTAVVVHRAGERYRFVPEDEEFMA